jgi:hypothetical protein
MQQPEPFTLDGWRYWTESRTCGKPTCQRCASGERHPGYWYRRNLQTNERAYLGRQLDDDIIQRASRLDVLRPTIRSHIEQIQRDLQLLERLVKGDAFELIERVRLEELGYGSVL